MGGRGSCEKVDEKWVVVRRRVGGRVGDGERV